MQCKYISDCKNCTNQIKKRSLIGPAREKVINSIIEKNMSSEKYTRKKKSLTLCKQVPML